MNKIKEKISKIIEILDAVYEIEVSHFNSKRENLKSLNLETLVRHVEQKEKDGEISTSKDLVRHISALIQD